jgi:hypothetical protein
MSRAAAITTKTADTGAVVRPAKKKNHITHTAMSARVPVTTSELSERGDGMS